MEMRLVDWLASGLLLMIGWWGTLIWAEIRQLRKDHDALKTRVSDEYMRKDDWRGEFDRLRQALREDFSDLKDSLEKQFERLWNAISQKADK